MHSDFVCHHGDVSTREPYFHVSERILSQVALLHIRDFVVEVLNSLRVRAAVVFGEKLLEGVGLFVLVCLPSRFLQVDDRRLFRSRLIR